MSFNVEFQASSTHVQFRPAGGGDWVDFIPLSDLDPPPAASAEGRYQKLSEVSKTDDYAVIAADAGALIRFNKTTAVGVSLPAVAGSDEEVYRFHNEGAGALTVSPDGAESIDGASALVLTTGSAADVWPNAAKTAWRSYVYLPDGDVLRAGNNLSDIASPLAARANLGLKKETIYAGSLSAVSLFSLIDLSAYRMIFIQGYARPATDTSALTLRFGDTGGSTWKDGSTDYAFSNVFGTGSATAYNVVPNASGIVIGLGSSDGNLASEGSQFDLTIQRFNQNSDTWVQGNAMSYNASGNQVDGAVRGKLKFVGALDSFKICYSTGNLAQLDILVEGIRL